VSVPGPWAVLGIEPTQDVLRIRRAYADALKRTNPEQDATGFAALRQAYELVLAQARLAARGATAPAAAPEPAAGAADVHAHAEPLANNPMPEATVTASPVPAPTGDAPVSPATPITPVSVSNRDLERLRFDFLSLQQLVAAAASPDPQKMQSLLEACLSSPTLENLSLHLDFERAVVQFLWQTRARTESLLEIVIDRWKWRERGRSAVAGREIAALVIHADNVLHVERMRESAPHVYRALTRPPQPVWLWTQIVGRGLESSTREVLDQFHGPATGMPSALNATALLWWQRFFARPHIRPEIVRATGILIVLGLFVGSVSTPTPQALLSHVWKTGLLFGFAGLAAAGLWFALVDWPRFKMKTFRRSASPGLRLGWAPASLASCIASALLPDGVVATIAVSVVCLCLMSWAVLMAPDVDDGLRPQHMLQRLGVALFLNAPLCVWWLFLASQPTESPTAPMWVSFVATLAAFAIGQSLLWVEFLRVSTSESRQWVRALLGALSLAALPVFLYVPVTNAWDRVLLTGMVAIVLVQRIPAVNLTVQQLKLRGYISFLPTVIVVQEFSHIHLGSTVRIGGILFMSGVALAMAASAYNEWKASKSAPALPDLRTGRARL
jgi:hypothetical protein